MARLFMMAMLVVATALAIAAVATAVRAVSPVAKGATGDNMSETVSKIAYVLLIVLMFGVATGWLGAA